MKVRKLITIVLIIVLAMFIKLPISNAAGLTIAFSKSNVSVGETINVTVNGSGISGKISLSVSGNATLSQNSIWVENSSQTVTATITGEGSIRITATPEDVADSTTAEPFTTATSGTLTATATSSNNPARNNDSNNNDNSNNDGNDNNNDDNDNKNNSNKNTENNISKNDESEDVPSKLPYTGSLRSIITVVIILIIISAVFCYIKLKQYKYIK